jgi:hypothetical protein
MKVRDIWLVSTCDLYMRRVNQTEPPKKLPSGGRLPEEYGRLLVVSITPRKFASEATPNLVLTVASPEAAG